MATGDEHRQHGFGQGPVLDDIDGDVRREVVHAIQGPAQSQRESLRGGDPDHQGARQTRPARDRDGVEIAQRDAGLSAGPLDRRHHGLQVRPARDFRDHAPEARMEIDTARDGIDKEGLATHDPDTGLIAGGLDAENEGLLAAHPAASEVARARKRRMTRASTSPGW